MKPWPELSAENQQRFCNLMGSFAVEGQDGEMAFPDEKTARMWAVEAYTFARVLANQAAE